MQKSNVIGFLQTDGAILDRLKDRVKARMARLVGGFAPPRYEPPMEAFWWYKAGQPPNFGDHLANCITTKVAADRNLFLDEAGLKPRRLFSIGSVLHFATDGDVIWGSGVNGKVPIELHRFRDLDVRAVRGPLTRDFLRDRGIAVPDIMGDPALLLPRLMASRFSRRGGGGIGIVPNLNDMATLTGDPRLISPLWPWADVVAAICRCDFIVSSSLHGIVIAEAFGIPCRWLRVSENEARFKFDDYALGTGRSVLTPAGSIERALEMGAMEPLSWDPEPLLAAFPTDLWD